MYLALFQKKKTDFETQKWPIRVDGLNKFLHSYKNNSTEPLHPPPPPPPSREFREAVVTDSLVNVQFSLLLNAYRIFYYYKKFQEMFFTLTMYLHISSKFLFSYFSYHTLSDSFAGGSGRPQCAARGNVSNASSQL